MGGKKQELERIVSQKTTRGWREEAERIKWLISKEGQGCAGTDVDLEYVRSSGTLKAHRNGSWRGA